MTHHSRLVAIVVAAALSISGMSFASDLPLASFDYAESIPVGMAEDLTAAMAQSSDLDRRDHLGEVLRKYLLEKDENTAVLAYRFVLSLERWLDLESQSAVFFDLQESRGWGLALYSRHLLARAPASQRRALYRQAMTQNGVDYPWGGRMVTLVARIDAAFDGMGDLEQLIIDSEDPSSDPGGNYPLDYLLATLRARDGGDTRIDAAARAAGRFAEMPAAQFERRMTDEEVFCRVVLEAADDICAVNPFDHTGHPGCRLFVPIVHDQLVRWRSDEAQKTGELPAWLEKLSGKGIGGTSLLDLAGGGEVQ